VKEPKYEGNRLIGIRAPRAAPHQCLVSSNVERYFVERAAEADDAMLRTLEDKTLADGLAELRILGAHA
jgi:Rrf2 family transcriptional regulator, repressor of oqxAB